MGSSNNCEGSEGFFLFQELGRPHINQVNLSQIIDYRIFRLDVSVDNAMRMEMLYC